MPPEEPSSPSSTPLSLAWVFVTLGALALLAAGAFAARFLGLSGSRVSLDRLSPEDRQRLVEQAGREAPGVFQPAWFETRVGYTLRPGARIEAWGDSFVANALGYRTHPPRKPARTFRVVFLGDSWTYGMGIRERDSFPAQFERLANRLRPAGSPSVQAWALALPGYNTFNELAALEIYFDWLRPDAVVLCPTHNDIDSSGIATPAGRLARSRARIDDFGDALGYRYFFPLLDAPSFERRWRKAFSEVASTERELRQRRIPFFLYFAATWEGALAHSLVAESGLRAPYAITPPELTLGRWRNPPPFRHGTPEANARYARLVYGLVAKDLGWPALGDREAEGEEARIFRSRPSPAWIARKEVAARQASESLPTSYVPGPSAAPQCLAAMDCENGLAPRASSFLLRRAPGASEVVLTLDRLREPSWIYPLPVAAIVADEKEEVHASFVLRADGPASGRYAIRLPHGRSVAIEVTLLAARETAAAQVLSGRAFMVRRIEQRALK